MNGSRGSSAAGDSAIGRTEEIRQVATKLFEQSGYSSTTMTDIATAVGVLQGSLYHHFDSKEDIALDILQDFQGELAALADNLSNRLRTEIANPRDQLVEIATAVTDLSLRSKAALRLIAYTAPSASSERFRAAREWQAPGLERVWKRAVQQLVPDPDPRTQDAGLLRFALDSLTLHSAVNPPGIEEAGRIVDLQTSMLLDGLASDVPPDEELNRSDAMEAARHAITTWKESGTPSEPASRDQIVAAARVEFARRGFDATTVRDIADAAGVRMGTMYRRVGSKEELLAEILTAYAEHMDGAVRSALTTGNSEVASLDALALVMVSAKRRFRLETEIVKLADPWSKPGNQAMQAYHASTRARLRLLEGVLERGATTGAIRSLGAPAAVGPQIRYISWVPYQDFARASTARAHRFLRNSLLRGFLQEK